MKTKFIAALVLAASASVAAPAFASGYGPAPFYRPEVGAPASQRGVSAQTLAAEQGNAVAAGNTVAAAQSDAAQSDVGGAAPASQSGGVRLQAGGHINDTFFGR